MQEKIKKLFDAITANHTEEDVQDDVENIKGDTRLADHIDSWADKMEFWQKINGCKQPDVPKGALRV